jgi:hypothetical protein
LTATTVSTDYCLIIIISIPINIIIAMAMAPGIIVGGADKIWLKN